MYKWFINVKYVINISNLGVKIDILNQLFIKSSIDVKIEN